MLERVLEPEVMDSAAEARAYDAMDHSHVNRAFVADFLAVWRGDGMVLDVGTGTAQIPIELCRQHPGVHVVAIDLAVHMLQVGNENIRREHLSERIRLERIDAKLMPFADGSFQAVMSNSIVHHIPSPGGALAEMVRVTAPGGVIFVRDLLRPEDDAGVQAIVATYAGDANAHQQQMFEDSLRAALSLAEVRDLVSGVGFDADSVRQTTDRHWTWSCIR
ncbi:MAG: class I SAM-dependent methyltransferase [Planctomycetes bacterium]|nr:class I SAM-dependent methyltransferase [Planctomycetota bacterium]